jgi:hypothetical protein
MSSHDSDLPDSGMASGSDAGEPGEHLGPSALEPDERRLLEALESDTIAPPDDDARALILEERAAEDEGPLPERGGPQGDGLDAPFSNPEDRLPE